jgi:hypothetical protein
MPVPDGWEARGGGSVIDRLTRAGDLSALERPYVHLANFPLTPSRGPYGSGVVGAMDSSDTFAAIVEFLPESAHTRLFRDVGFPRTLRAAEFSPSTLQRTLSGQLGVQRFFSINGRALCLYAVMGGVPALRNSLPTLNLVLRETSVRKESEIS